MLRTERLVEPRWRHGRGTEAGVDCELRFKHETPDYLARRAGDHAGPADARGRLDALARQLGERLRAVEGLREPSEHADRLAPDDENSGKAH